MLLILLCDAIATHTPITATYLPRCTVYLPKRMRARHRPFSVDATPRNCDVLRSFLADRLARPLLLRRAERPLAGAARDCAAAAVAVAAVAAPAAAASLPAIGAAVTPHHAADQVASAAAAPGSVCAGCCCCPATGKLIIIAHGGVSKSCAPTPAMVVVSIYLYKQHSSLVTTRAHAEPWLCRRDTSKCREEADDLKFLYA